MSVVVWASGYYGPQNYLDDGGARVMASPEFYWDLEVKRLAREYHPPEKFKPTPPAPEVYDASASAVNPREKSTEKADWDDFNEALKTGAIRPADSDQATRQHSAARDFVNKTTEKTTDPLPSEFDSEFADYHRGAYAYRLGQAHWEEAKKAWEALLARPAEQRHYRSVWAAFMLGKLAMKEGNPDAVKWFEMTRQLAKDEFADSLGMAADSYGWEGRSEWKQGHPGKAAPLFLNQLALGDESAVVSLKALVPDRIPVVGNLNYGNVPDDFEGWDDGQLNAYNEKNRPALEAAAADPLMRRLVTANILAAGTGISSSIRLAPMRRPAASAGSR